MSTLLHIRTRIIGFCLLFTCAGFTGHAQSWQWGKSGGSIFDGLNNLPYESVIDMATDKNGNIYTLALIEASNPVTFDGHVLTTYGQKDMYVFKYDCNGTYKWGKVIGGPEVDFPNAIATDTLGHVYVSGSVTHASQPAFSGQVHFDTDSTLGLTNYKTLFLVQYDTAGNMKWLRQPNPDTAGYTSNATISRRYAMEVTPGGDVYWLVVLNPGVITGGGSPWVVPATSTWLLKYNAQGVMTDHIAIQLELEKAMIDLLSMSRSKTGRIVIAGAQEILPASNKMLRMGGQDVAHTMFMGVFNPAGQLLWKKENSSAVSSAGHIYRKALIDDKGSIYVAGVTYAGDSFNTYQFRNSISSLPYDMPFLTKMDSNGNHQWTRAAGAVTANLNNSLDFRNSTELWLSGTSNSLAWDSTHVFAPNGSRGYQYCITRFDTAGHVLSLDTLVGDDGGRNLLAASAADRKGNLYIGGQLGGNITVGGQLRQNMGGRTDVFLAKFGYANCNCTAAPVSAFTKTLSNRTVTLAYSGTGTPDSVRWSFGNGVTLTKTGSSINTAFAYSYPAGQNGLFSICATVYSACGTAQACQDVTIGSSSVGGVAGRMDVRVYPNPAADYVMIEGALDGTHAALLDLAGRQISSTVIGPRQQLSLAGLPAGAYLLVLTTQDARAAVRILKQ